MSAWITTQLDGLAPGAPRHERLGELMAEIREGVTAADPTAAQLTAPIVEALEVTIELLHDRAEIHRDLVEYHEFNGLTVAEVRAARAHLALHHAVADRLAACLTGFVRPEDPNPSAPLRQALYAALGTEDLAYTLNHQRVVGLPDD